MAAVVHALAIRTSRAGESVRGKPISLRQAVSRRCAGAGGAGAQADTVGAARLGAIGARGKEIAAPWTLPLHHAGHRLPRPSVDRARLRLRFRSRRRPPGHALSSFALEPQRNDRCRQPLSGCAVPLGHYLCPFWRLSGWVSAEGTQDGVPLTREHAPPRPTSAADIRLREAGCVWEERLPGASGLRHCDGVGEAVMLAPPGPVIHMTLRRLLRQPLPNS